MQRNTARPAGRFLAALAATTLVLAACSGGDDDDAGSTATAESATASADGASSDTASSETTVTTTATTTPTTGSTATTTPAADTTVPGDDDTSSGDDETIVIDDINDLPDDCRNALSDFLKQIEPKVADIDWDTATMSDFQALNDELEAEGESFDAATAGCEQFDFASDEESLQAVIDFAEDEAPGTVGWLEFIGSLFTSTGSAAEGPATCDEAIAYMDDLLSQGVTMNELPVSEFGNVTQAMNTISTDCSEDVVSEFFAREDVTNFVS